MTPLANTDAFAMQRSDLNGFLFADVGVEANGMTLSVLSTLARMGMDPWDEAGRLARQPKSTATEALARVIAAMPTSVWPLPDAMAIATRLVALLPSRHAAAVLPARSTTMLNRIRPRKSPASGATPSRSAQPSTLVLMVLAGLLAGLTVYLVSQRWAANLDAQPASASDTVVPGSMNKGA
jgi:hypothetical protein